MAIAQKSNEVTKERPHSDFRSWKSSRKAGEAESASRFFGEDSLFMASSKAHVSIGEASREKSRKFSRSRPLLSRMTSTLTTISEPVDRRDGGKPTKSISKKSPNLTSSWNQATHSINSSFNRSVSNSSRTSNLSDGSDTIGDDTEYRLMRRKMSKRLTRGLKTQQSLAECLTKEQIRGKFRYAIRVVRVIVRLHLALVCYSRERDEDSGQSLDQLNYYSMESEFTTEKLVFSKSYFLASNLSYMPAWACKVLVLPPEERSQSDVAHIASLIRRFFTKTFLEENLLYLCKHCTYTRYEKKRVLIRRGHRPLYCYLLFSGSVFVNIEEQDERSGRRFYRTKAVLKKGVVFGEIGVIHGVPRTATIISRENVECLLIPPDVCMRVFPEEIDRDYNLRLSYMKKSDLFVDWPDEALRQMCLVSKTTEYSFNEVIDKNTRESEFIYMIIKGRVEIMNYVDMMGESSQQKAPLDHAFLPPLPVPRPQNLSGSAKLKDRMVVSIDFLYPFQCCDLLSLIKAAKPTPLILVSRGAEVIRFPKLRLQTIPPLKCWKSLLEKAKTSPKYPGEKVLSRLCLEHREWSAYKKLVLWDSIDKASGRFHAMKPETYKTAVANLTPAFRLEDDEDEDDSHSLEEFKACMQTEAPLHDLVKHRHKGPCIQSWNYLNGSLTKRTNRSLSTSC